MLKTRREVLKADEQLVMQAKKSSSNEPWAPWCDVMGGIGEPDAK